jgi:hypothetical protein
VYSTINLVRILLLFLFLSLAFHTPANLINKMGKGVCSGANRLVMSLLATFALAFVPPLCLTLKVLMVML